MLALASAFRTASRPAGLHLEVLEAPTAAEVDPAGRVASDLAGGRLRLQAGPSLWSLDPDGQVTERLDLRPWMARAEAVVAAPGGAVVVGRPGHAGGAASGDDDPLPASATRSAADDLVVLALRRQGESLQVRWRREVRAGPGRRAALGGMVGGVEGMALVTRVLRLGEGPRHDQTFERAQLLTFDPDAALRWERPLAGAPGDDWRLLAAGTQGLLLWTRGALALASTRSPSARAVALPGEAWTRPPRAAAGTPSGFELVRSDGLAVALRAP